MPRKKPTFTRECMVCGREFTATSKDKLACSLDHAARIIPCIVCKRRFVRKNFSNACSKECRRKWYLSKRKREYAENREEILAQQKRIRDASSPIRDRKCANPQCHNMVSSRYNRKTCTKECAKVVKKAHDRQYYQANKATWVKRDREVRERAREQRAQFPLMRQCVALKDDGDRCGKEFDVTHPNTRAVTCSEKCRRARLREIERIRYHADIAASREKARLKASYGLRVRRPGADAASFFSKQHL
jgi:hypothetical protein